MRYDVDAIVTGSRFFQLVSWIDERSTTWLAHSIVGRVIAAVANEVKSSRIVAGVLAVGAGETQMDESLIGRGLNRLTGGFSRRLNGLVEGFESSRLGQVWANSYVSRLAKPEIGIAFLLVYLPLSVWLTSFLPYFIKFAAEGVLALMVGSVLLQVLTGRRQLKWTVLDGPVLIWLLIGVLSALLNENSVLQSVAGLRSMFQYYLVAWVISNAGLDEKAIKRIIYTLIGMAAVLGLVGVAQWVLRVKTPTEWVDVTESSSITTRAFATFGNPNQFAGWLALLAAPMISLWNTKLEPKVRFGLMTALVFALGSIAFTYSRSAWFGLAFALLVIAVVKDRRILLLILMGAILLPIASPSLAARVGQGFSVGYYQKSASGGRIDSWNKAMQINELNPVFGVGPGQFGGAAANYFGTKANLYVGLSERFPLWVDSQIFQYLAEVGYAGVIAFLWLLLTFLRAARKVYAEADAHARAIVLGFGAAMGGLLIQSIFGSMWEMQAISSVAWSGMALVAIMQRDGLFRRAPQRA